jgi:hypothetical protein
MGWSVYRLPDVFIFKIDHDRLRTELARRGIAYTFGRFIQFFPEFRRLSRTIEFW